MGIAVERPKLFLTLIALLCMIALSVSAYQILPLASDWSTCYRPSLLSIVLGRSPYAPDLMATCPILVPPWILLLLIPFALLPARLGRAVLFVATLASYAVVAIKLKAKPVGLAAILLSYPVVYGLIYGQIDGLISLGFLLPTPWALLVLSAKPQMSIAAAIYLLIEAWQIGRWKNVLRCIAPVSVAYLISFLLYGNWLVYITFPIGRSGDTSLWPQSLPIGLVLLLVAIRQRQLEKSITASPFLSPYLATHSWAVSLLGLSPDTFYVTVASVSIWIVWLLGGGASNG